MSTTQTKRGLLARAVDVYGCRHQVIKAMEELGELIQALAKYETEVFPGDAAGAAAEKMHADHIAEEIADVRIMLQQMCLIFRVESRAAEWEAHKLTRLAARLRGEEARHDA